MRGLIGALGVLAGFALAALLNAGRTTRDLVEHETDWSAL